MKQTRHFQTHKQPMITFQDVFYVLTLLAISLWFCLVPTPAFGQPPLGPIGSSTFSAFDSPPPLDIPPLSAEPAIVPVVQSVPEISAVPFAGSLAQQQPGIAFASSELPVSVAAAPSLTTANRFSQMQSQHQLRNPQHEVAVTMDHPFRQYWGIPNDPYTKITGKTMMVAELLAGTRSPVVRQQLLQAYWELSGLLAVYHFRCETERQAGSAAGQQQDMMILLREQRRTAEVEFIKQQWVLAELLKQHKGRTLRESELPIPADYPLYPRYQTHASQIARTERTQHLGRMIPIQEQLIESKNGTWRAASEMIPSAAQPFFAISNQRTMAFLDLTKAIVDYNKMIAEYALGTIPSNISSQQFVGAVVRLPKGNAVPIHSQVSQVATESIRLTQYEAPAEVTAQPVEQVAYEFQVDYQSPPVPPSFPIPEVIETREPEFVPAAASSFLMDF